MTEAQIKFWDKIYKVGEIVAVPDATLRTWKKRGYVPASRHYEFSQIAIRAKIKLTIKDLNSTMPR